MNANRKQLFLGVQVRFERKKNNNTNTYCMNCNFIIQLSVISVIILLSVIIRFNIRFNICFVNPFSYHRLRRGEPAANRYAVAYGNHKPCDRP